MKYSEIIRIIITLMLLLTITLIVNYLYQFSGEKGEMLQQECAEFCKDQYYSLEALRQCQNKDAYLAQFIQVGAWLVVGIGGLRAGGKGMELVVRFD